MVVWVIYHKKRFYSFGYGARIGGIQGNGLPQLIFQSFYRSPTSVITVVLRLNNVQQAMRMLFFKSKQCLST